MSRSFNKFPYPANFQFTNHLDSSAVKIGEESFPLEIAASRDGITHVYSALRARRRGASQAELTFQPDSTAPCVRDSGHGFVVTHHDQSDLLRSVPGMALGLCGQSFMLCFQHDPSYRYYGMGEKLLGLELTGIKTMFWNTDAFGDFDGSLVMNGKVDPYYVSIPYLIIHTPQGWVGLLLNNPYTPFMTTASDVRIEGIMAVNTGQDKMIALGAEDGELDLYVVTGESLAELTRRFQTLVGRTPLPPLWSLGYHQCRWGYRSADDLRELKARFAEHQIPVDGLWLDIDYMDGYRVFTMHPDAFPQPAADLQDIMRDGHRVVPIIDPGVKRDPGYSLYNDGVKHDVFCKNAEKNDFIGLVWPGETAFPDFSTEEARTWWAGHTAAFAAQGIEGAWLDMNDPSVGPVRLDDMRFNKGQDPHEVFHNQYGMGMAKATRKGFLRARPDRRPFLISRSSYISGARYAAVWTGDNAPNYTYLRHTIPTCLNLALSGIPFTGGDVGGFAGDTSASLLRDWMRAGFLMPFFRNHTAHGTRQQEPWAYDKETLEVCRAYIRARYTLLPYVYQLFVAQEETGEAILRPLFYEFAMDQNGEDISREDDIYMLGPSVLHAPVLEENATSRDVMLPGPAQWFSVMDQRWVEGGQRLKNVPVAPDQTPLYFRDGSLIAMRPGVPVDHRTDLSHVEWHIFARGDGVSCASTYVVDDGLSYAYQRGKRTRVMIESTVENNVLDVKVEAKETGFGPVRARIVVYGDIRSIRVNGQNRETEPLQTDIARCTLSGLATAEPVCVPAA